MKPYRKVCCGAPCAFEGRPDEPCWGDTRIVDEQFDDDDSCAIHACEGHDVDGGYDPQPPDPDPHPRSKGTW